MKRLDTAIVALLTACAVAPAEAAEFVVVSAVGAREPSGLAAGQRLDEGTRLALEP